VRELAHAIERAVLLAAGSRVGAADLRLDAPAPSASGAGLEGMSLEDAERVLIRTALARCGGRVEQAAAELGLSRSALYRRLEKLGLGTGEA
jgi:DNA-binding NtrC family response regulator